MDGEMRLANLVIEYYKQCGPGPHKVSEGYEYVKKRAEELGLFFTDSDIKREFRDVAGYP